MVPAAFHAQSQASMVSVKLGDGLSLGLLCFPGEAGQRLVGFMHNQQNKPSHSAELGEEC